MTPTRLRLARRQRPAKPAPVRRTQPRTSAALGAHVRALIADRQLTQDQVAAKAHLRPSLVSTLVRGGNVSVQYYERVAVALGFAHALDMLGAPDKDTRALLRLWRRLGLTERVAVLRDLKRALTK